ncbi:hypothetical protein [Tateyamaria omphalii]|uniref:Uncharacterized protein n=1 Tax=Tateyamaria omphalii TaxID=299262 RepID=A0A1P8MT33_9RHOB|nr:hypothetical protein [Tateyamaria omphalii]APX11204.1 hypothetical protein BWR18_05520 [Tateyamaria omphalii]
MTEAMRLLLKGCLMAALLVYCGPSSGQGATLPRADIVSCVRAVNDLDDIMWTKMRSHCLVIAGSHCEAPVSGPILDCLADITRDMTMYVASALPHLPDTVEADGFRRLSYLSIVERLRAPDDAQARCMSQHSKAFDQSICLSVAAFGRLIDVFTVARYANVTLP